MGAQATSLKCSQGCARIGTMAARVVAMFIFFDLLIHANGDCPNQRPAKYRTLLSVAVPWGSGTHKHCGRTIEHFEDCDIAKNRRIADEYLEILTKKCTK